MCIYICNIICDIISDIYVNIPCWMHLNIFKSPSNVSASVKPSQRNVPLGFIVLQWWVWEDPNEKNRSRFTMASIGYSMLIRLWDTRRLFEESHPDWNHYPSGFFSSHGIIMKSILRKSHEITGYNWHSKDSLQSQPIVPRWTSIVGKNCDLGLTRSWWFQMFLPKLIVEILDRHG